MVDENGSTKESQKCCDEKDLPQDIKAKGCGFLVDLTTKEEEKTTKTEGWWWGWRLWIFSRTSINSNKRSEN